MFDLMRENSMTCRKISYETSTKEKEVISKIFFDIQGEGWSKIQEDKSVIISKFDGEDVSQPMVREGASDIQE